MLHNCEAERQIAGITAKQRLAAGFDMLSSNAAVVKSKIENDTQLFSDPLLDAQENLVKEIMGEADVESAHEPDKLFAKRTWLDYLLLKSQLLSRASDPVAFSEKFADQCVAYLEAEAPICEVAHNIEFLATFAQRRLSTIDEEHGTELEQSFAERIMPIFVASNNVELREYARQIENQLRLLASVGKELEFECILMNGEKFNLKDYRDKIVLVNIWATWCGPCVREFPNMKTQYEKYKDRGFEMIAYSIDAEVDTIKAFQEKNQYPWLVGSQKMSEEQGMKNYYEFYGSSGVPTTFLVGRDGKVLFRMVSSDDDQLNAALEKAFGE